MLSDLGVREKLKAAGQEVIGGGPELLRDLISKQRARVIEISKIIDLKSDEVGESGHVHVRKRLGASSRHAGRASRNRDHLCRGRVGSDRSIGGGRADIPDGCNHMRYA